MKRALVVSVALMLVASYAGAAVVDSFEDPWSYNYTEVYISGGTSTEVLSGAGSATDAVDGNTGLAPVSGSKLGVGQKGAGSSSNRTRTHLWNGAQNQMGQPVSVWMALNGSSADGGGLVVKTIDYGNGLVGGYVVKVGDLFSGGNLRVELSTHNLWQNGGGGAAFTNAGQLNAADHSGVVQTTLNGGADQWLKITATLTAVGATNVLDATIHDINSNLLGTYQYVDSGAQAVNARAPGAAGLFVWSWNGSPDFDDLDIVPEPATLGLLAIGGVLALLRRRR